MITLINARIPAYQDRQQVEINAAGKIERITEMGGRKKGEKIIDMEGDWLSLGGVDLQINGGLGLAFPDLEITDLEKLDKISDYLGNQGIDGYLPTLVTTSVEKFQIPLSNCQIYRKTATGKSIERPGFRSTFRGTIFKL